MSSPREQMVDDIKAHGFTDQKVLSVMLKIPREEFIPSRQSQGAYSDNALSIGFNQTISQPYTVAFMTYLLDLKGEEKVLEIGTGSGYQAAVLSLLSKSVYSVEIIPELAEKAAGVLKKLNFNNVFVKRGNGEEGWVEESPFDAIIVTAGMDFVPQTLFDQLKKNGILVAPVGVGNEKTMTRFTRIDGKISKQEFGKFRFVPFV